MKRAAPRGWDLGEQEVGRCVSNASRHALTILEGHIEQGSRRRAQELELVEGKIAASRVVLNFLNRQQSKGFGK